MEEHMDNMQQLLSSLPKMDNLLSNEQITNFKHLPKALLMELINEVLEEHRKAILVNKLSTLDKSELIKTIVNRLSETNASGYTTVINGTGTILHTNLGRAMLSTKAIEAAVKAASSYSSVEFNLLTGKRGDRNAPIEKLITKITGAEAAIAVNNNASAVLLVLSALATRGETIVSRGELVEIGGSFRIPDIMELSGTTLREVGTTNRTNLNDYKNAINENTSLIMKIHQSNFKILGFTEEVSINQLSKLANEHHLPLIHDIGSGLISNSFISDINELSVLQSLSEGASLITFSGDKLLGGPQCGIILGKKALIDTLKNHPLFRALRPDKITLAALEATLMSYLEGANLTKEIPILRMLNQTQAELKKKALLLSRAIKKLEDNQIKVEVIQDYSKVGGGTLPLENLPTYAIELSCDIITPNALEERLRNYDIPIIARINKSRVLLDVRTLLDKDSLVIVKAIEHISSSLNQENCL
jgi:L-seryl-tRNA(Ser) seleniumtransferase